MTEALRDTVVKNTYRFFVSPEAIGRTGINVTGPQAHQMANVLRLEEGQGIVVLDNSGWQYNVELTSVHGEKVAGAIRAKSLVDSEPRIKITLYQGLLRSNKFEVILQKCTELGVVAIVPTISERCVLANIGDVSAAKLERWRRIVIEAAEQSGRGKLPALRPATLFQQACEQVRGLACIAWEGEDGTSLRKFLLESNLTKIEVGDGDDRRRSSRPFSVSVFVGPEGGFSSWEVHQAQSYGIVPVGLGRRILRAETAAVAATAITLYESGDLED